MEERITELEIKLAYQEDLLQTLNQIVTDQQSQIKQLELTCKSLSEAVLNLASIAKGQSGLELPPHY
ncbi:MAG: SlyX protein [Methylobacter sp.]|nr:MAG: SlyX protein [Methylobacter sp.]